MKKLLILAIIGLLAVPVMAQEDDDGILFGGIRVMEEETDLTVGIATNPFGGEFWTFAYTHWDLKREDVSARLDAFEVKFAYLFSLGKFRIGPMIGGDTEREEIPTKPELIAYIVAAPGFIGTVRLGTWGGGYAAYEYEIAIEPDVLFENGSQLNLGAFFNF